MSDPKISCVNSIAIQKYLKRIAVTAWLTEHDDAVIDDAANLYDALMDEQLKDGDLRQVFDKYGVVISREAEDDTERQVIERIRQEFVYLCDLSNHVVSLAKE